MEAGAEFMTAPESMPEDDGEDDESAALYFDLRRRRVERPLRELPTLIRDAIRLVRQSAPSEFFGNLGLSVLVGLLTAVQLLFVRRVLSSVVGFTKGQHLSSVATPLVGFVASYAAVGVLGVLQSERRKVLAELVTRHAEGIVSLAAANAELIDFESPAFHNRLRRALVNAAFRPISLTFASVDLVSSLLTAAGVLTALALVEPLLAILVVAAVGPVWLGTKRMTRLGYLFDLEETEADRRRAYFLYLLSDKRSAKELRAYQLAKPFSEQREVLWNERIVRVKEISRKRTRISVISRLVNAAMLAGVISLLIWLVGRGDTSISSATVVAGSLVILGQRLTSVVGSIGDLYEGSLFLGDVQSFLQDEGRKRDERGQGTPHPGFEEFQAENISFTYPSREERAVDNVSLTVRRGEVVALVGANGSGKTTLAKIIAQLYRPSAGMVTWNGQNAAGLSVEMLRDRIAVIFQDFERYYFTVGENIGFGRYEHAQDRVAVSQAANLAGVFDFVSRLPHGFDSLLGPEYIGGHDLSVGQWQRLAVARAFFRNADLIVLDEPSSALDPEAETQLFERLRLLGSGKGVVVVSHRFSTVKSADRIIVMNHGRIIEEGSHTELMSAKGEYARLFTMQAAHYLPEPFPAD